MDWVEELSDVGIEDVHRLVPPEDVNTAIARMVPEIREGPSRPCHNLDSSTRERFGSSVICLEHPH